MAKPRIFVSSTYYDLKHIRNSLQEFIESLGYESVLYEDGDIPFHHDTALDNSCYEEIRKCHIMVLIIGGRYGSASSDQDDASEKIEFYNSVTKKEYDTARKEDVPIYIFIDKNVLSEYHTYKRNRNNNSIEYAHVDNVNIFKLVDEIYSQKRNNLIKDFEKFDEISGWLREQWSGLFADFLSEKNKTRGIADLSTQVGNLQDVSSVLKEYTESILSKLQPENFDRLISTSNEKLRERQFSNFENNSFMRYLIAQTPKGFGMKKLFHAFEESDSLEEFLSKAKINEKEVHELINNSPAKEDFKKLKDHALFMSL